MLAVAIHLVVGCNMGTRLDKWLWGPHAFYKKLSIAH